MFETVRVQAREVNQEVIVTRKSEGLEKFEGRERFQVTITKDYFEALKKSQFTKAELDLLTVILARDYANCRNPLQREEQLALYEKVHLMCDGKAKKAS